jgi:hypothetical protein
VAIIKIADPYSRLRGGFVIFLDGTKPLICVSVYQRIRRLLLFYPVELIDPFKEIETGPARR